MKLEHVLTSLTADNEPARCARSMLLWNMWDVHPTISCGDASTVSDGARLDGLGLGKLARRNGRRLFTRNEQGAEMADRLRAMGYKADGRIYT